ncbi:hypothetical protein DFH08DRAFT_854432 [Mycena albidolilacea]|uniref:Uncharacterized protein n=1 Tax=Mycena albidolilacea TaxID=1033008 RepID=A0AAD7ABI5_9AGAR|nr:hypothetical protein DFH08DRAFT_854432 [Mycena albidolilacea]
MPRERAGYVRRIPRESDWEDVVKGGGEAGMYARIDRLQWGKPKVDAMQRPPGRKLEASPNGREDGRVVCPTQEYASRAALHARASCMRHRSDRRYADDGDAEQGGARDELGGEWVQRVVATQGFGVSRMSGGGVGTPYGAGSGRQVKEDEGASELQKPTNRSSRSRQAARPRPQRSAHARMSPLKIPSRGPPARRGLQQGQDTMYARASLRLPARRQEARPPEISATRGSEITAIE